MAEKTDIAGLILCGGLSTRMGGGDKGLLHLAGRPLLAHLVDRLAPQVKKLAISANGDPARFDAFALPVLPDTLPDHPGPLAGILAGMGWAEALGALFLLSVAGDTPLLPTDLLGRLAAASDRDRIAVASSGGRVHPVIALWPVALRVALYETLRSPGNGSVRGFIERHPHAIVDFPLDAATGADPFFNINRPADLEAAAAFFPESRT